MTTAVTARVVYVTLLVASWIVLLALMWQALHTLPSAEALADDRPIRPPLPFDFTLESVRSLVEVSIVVILLWPWWQRRYLVRTLAVTLLMMIWFYFTVPLELNTMEWLHRRWLAFVIMSLISVLIIGSIYRVVRGGGRAPTTSS